jgi:hypothetical protein
MDMYFLEYELFEHHILGISVSKDLVCQVGPCACIQYSIKFTAWDEKSRLFRMMEAEMHDIGEHH